MFLKYLEKVDKNNFAADNKQTAHQHHSTNHKVSDFEWLDDDEQCLDFIYFITKFLSLFIHINA